ncbi:hypothetical protein CTI12_AA455450 [Artemisia annua]|uniref:CCHC-type domain-containing protein n=1 Tax=Artemisia annua TaxID=35608 RepID=A0A2U1LLU2_ARTAN|nr:hypothetical protein CTI12_AA455450 [Artemisia annua]
MANTPPENCLLGKVIADNHIVHKQSVISILRNAWKNYNPVNISPWKNNFFKFAFENKEDIRKILHDSPWSVMGYYVAFAPWDSNKTLNELEFNRGEFWIQVHDLPLGMLSSEYATELANSLGKLIELDCVDEGPQTDRDFLRFRVEIDITKPLVPGFFISRSGGKESWVTFKYERLSDFCYRCGCLGHGRESCTNNVIAKYEGKWSSEMRAPTVRRLQKPNQHQHTSRFPKHLTPTTTHSQKPKQQPSSTTSSQPPITDIPHSPGICEHYTATSSSSQEAETSTITTDTTLVCSDYYVTEPPEFVTPPTPLIPRNVSIDVSLAAALSKLNMKRKCDDESLDSSSGKRMKSLSWGVSNVSYRHISPTINVDANQPNDKIICDNREPDNSFDQRVATSQSLARNSLTHRPPLIVVSERKRRGRPKGNNITIMGTSGSNLLESSDDLIDVPVEMEEFNPSKNSQRVVVADPKQPHAKC